MSRNYWTLGKEGMKTRLSKAQAAYENAVENVSDLHVKISDGNNKLGAIPSVSLIPVMDCGNCAICAKSCYDLRNDFIYKEVIKTRAINSAIYHEDPERFFKEIDDYLNYRYPRAFRFHIGGDIQNKWYLDKMCEIARKHKDTKFLAFTKMFDVCNTSTLMMETSFLRTCTSYSADGLVLRWITTTDFRRRILSSRAERLLRKEHVCVPETVQSV